MGSGGIKRGQYRTAGLGCPLVPGEYVRFAVLGGTGSEMERETGLEPATFSLEG